MRNVDRAVCGDDQIVWVSKEAALFVHGLRSDVNILGSSGSDVGDDPVIPIKHRDVAAAVAILGPVGVDFRETC